MKTPQNRARLITKAVTRNTVSSFERIIFQSDAVSVEFGVACLSDCGFQISLGAFSSLLILLEHLQQQEERLFLVTGLSHAGGATSLRWYLLMMITLMTSDSDDMAINVIR